jgi:hypothetical protein
MCVDRLHTLHARTPQQLEEVERRAETHEPGPLAVRRVRPEQTRVHDDGRENRLSHQQPRWCANVMAVSVLCRQVPLELSRQIRSTESLEVLRLQNTARARGRQWRRSLDRRPFRVLDIKLVWNHPDARLEVPPVNLHIASLDGFESLHSCNPGVLKQLQRQHLPRWEVVLLRAVVRRQQRLRNADLAEELEPHAHHPPTLHVDHQVPAGSDEVDSDDLQMVLRVDHEELSCSIAQTEGGTVHPDLVEPRLRVPRLPHVPLAEVEQDLEHGLRHDAVRAVAVAPIPKELLARRAGRVPLNDRLAQVGAERSEESSRADVSGVNAAGQRGFRLQGRGDFLPTTKFDHRIEFGIVVVSRSELS